MKGYQNIGDYFRPSLASQIADKHDINLQNFYRSMLINTTRLNRSNSLLHDIKGQIEHIEISVQADKKAAYKTLSEEATLSAKFNLGNEQGQCVPFWLSSALSIWFDPASGMFTLQTVVNRSLSIDTLVELSEYHTDLKMALGFYREVWSSLHEKTILPFYRYRDLLLRKHHCVMAT
ncbi:hypothetical protein ACYZT2_08940 [Pseudomonas sp. MDT1-85]